MSRWTHAQCERCWIADNPVYEPGTGLIIGVTRLPTRIRNEAGVIADPAVCCFCKELTIGGIYVRGDPAVTGCTHDD